MFKKISSLAHKQQGATAVEYALIAGLLAAVLVAGMALLGGGMTTFFAFVSGELATL